MRKLLAAALILIILAAIWNAAQQPACQEDMPCWNCETMGNKICGPDKWDTQFDTWQFYKDGGVLGLRQHIEDGYSLIVCADELTCLHETGHVVFDTLDPTATNQFIIEARDVEDAPEWLTVYLDAEQFSEAWAESYALYHTGADLPTNLIQFFE